MMVETGSGEQPRPTRPDAITPKDGKPVPIDWLTDHIGCALLPHPQLIGQAALVIVQANPSDPSQCKIVGPQGPEMATMIGVLIQMGADVRDLKRRVDAHDLGIRLVE